MVGLGMIEILLCCLFIIVLIMCLGYVGILVLGCEFKFVLVGDKLEVCFCGLYVMCGYWCLGEEFVVLVFDEDGYYCSGDVLCFYDLEYFEKGFVFDGCIVEDFKFSFGIFVSVGLLCVCVIVVGVLYV